MGITKNDIELLIFAKEKLTVSFDRSLTLGRMQLFAKKNDLISLLSNYDQNFLENSDLRYSEAIFQSLGANEVESIDFSNYEDASIVHDLNKPVKDEYQSRYDTIFDGGTLEHVFDFSTAIQNCIKMLKVNGHYIGVTPINNQMGHGFYQFSPELYYRVFSETNGFKVRKMMVRVGSSLFEVNDPHRVNSRVELINSTPTNLIVIAKKIREYSTFTTPQQSDYLNAWSINQSLMTGEKRVEDSKIIHSYRKIAPLWMKRLTRKAFNKLINRKSHHSELGVVNPKYFKKIDLSD